MINFGIAFCEGRTGNQIFQYVELRRRFKFFVQVSGGLKRFHIKRHRKGILVCLHPRLYRLAKRLTLWFFRSLELPVLTELTSSSNGPTGDWNSDISSIKIAVAHDFFFVVGRRIDRSLLDEGLFYSHSKQNDEYDAFLHVRLGDYLAFQANGNRLDYDFYYLYYVESLKQLRLDHPTALTLALCSDEPTAGYVKKIFHVAVEFGFEVTVVDLDEGRTWNLMTSVKQMAICSASTYSLSAALIGGVPRILIPKNWLNFNKGETYPDSMAKSKLQSSSESSKIWEISQC